MFRIGFLVMLLCAAPMLWSADEIVTFDSAEQRELYYSLLKEYRCLKCQNQNLADSNAGLAGDLRREIRDQILGGSEKQDIDSYLIARYGDFVLYSPPFSSKTAVLWIAPFALLVIALLSVFIMIRRQRKITGGVRHPKLSANELERARLEKARRLLRD